nr:hypothetical protein [Tanacetum cinerariifolium]
MSEGLRHAVEHGQAQSTLESIEAYDPEAKTKYIVALQPLNDLKYPLVDQLKGLKDAPMDVIMAAMYLESDTGDDAQQWVRDLRLSSSQLTIPVYPEVATLQEQVSGEEKLKAAFEEFKRYEDSQVEQRCAEMDARLDALSIDFDEELYPHMLTAIAGRRWMIGHGLCLAVMKCGESLDLRQAFADVVSAEIAKGMSEGLRHAVEHGQAQSTLESIEAYDPE